MWEGSLPLTFCPYGTSDEVETALVGLHIDTVKVANKVEGGLTLIGQRYGKPWMVILGYTELGEWLEYAGEVMPDGTPLTPT